MFSYFASSKNTIIYLLDTVYISLWLLAEGSEHQYNGWLDHCQCSSLIPIFLIYPQNLASHKSPFHFFFWWYLSSALVQTTTSVVHSVCESNTIQYIIQSIYHTVLGSVIAQHDIQTFLHTAWN